MTDPQSTPGEPAGDTARIDESVIHATNPRPPSGNPHVDTLAETIGPRAPGSQEERDAADYLISALDAAGLPAARLSSTTPRFGSIPDLATGLLALLAILVTVVLPALGVILLVAALALMLAGLLGYVNLNRWSPTAESIDVLTIVPPSQAEIRRLVVTATLDSGRVGILSRRHLAHFYAWTHLLIVISTTAALLVGVIVLVDAENTLRPVLAVPALGIIAGLALLGERQLGRQTSPGAITNASGVAALAEIAATASRKPPEWLEVWILGVGAATVPGGGMSTFLQRNTFDPDTTYFVHLQSPGGGPPKVPMATGAGLRSVPAAPLLTWIFDSTRADAAVSTQDTLQRLPVETLAHASHRAGYQTIVVAGVDESGKIPFLDDPEDLPFQVQEEGIRATVELVTAAIDALDREVAARAMLARSTASIQDTIERPAVDEDLPTDDE